ncbi:MAG TPA: Gfo/Idh/MocA family oxidoreductase, partial [Nitrospira sp.]|nr:Gfo/Idh/MocA family oxidoreductase [Nitrospira sp.]
SAGQALDIPTVHDSWQGLIDDEQVEAVVVAVPPSSPLEVVTAALRAGKHVLCKNPLASMRTRLHRCANSRGRAAECAWSIICFVQRRSEFD